MEDVSFFSALSLVAGITSLLAGCSFLVIPHRAHGVSRTLSRTIVVLDEVLVRYPRITGWFLLLVGGVILYLGFA